MRVIGEDGTPEGPGGSGYLVIDRPWPAMTRGVWGDPARTQEVYWDRFKQQGHSFAGDGAPDDEDGDAWLLGRVDDVMNVSGHEISTTEVESAVVAHVAVAEAAVVGAADPTTGQAVVAFVILRASVEELDENLPAAVAELLQHVVSEIGPIALPQQIVVVPEPPKTRSGKIMRRLLRDIAENRTIGDAATLSDPTIVHTIAATMNQPSGSRR